MVEMPLFSSYQAPSLSMSANGGDDGDGLLEEDHSVYRWHVR
jgi:hypothetical protein